MVPTTSSSPRKVKDMVTYFEKRRDRPAQTISSRRRKSVAAMMSLTRRPWEHFPRRKSSASTDRRRSSTSTRSNSTAYDLAEEYPGYAASERSGTSTAVSEGKRRSANPDYDWEHDSIADLKASLNKLDLSSASRGSLAKGNDTPNELHLVDSAGVESKRSSSGAYGVHEIDFVDPSAPRTIQDEARSNPVKEPTTTPTEPLEQAEASNSETSRSGIYEDEIVTKSAAVESKAAETADSSQQFVEAKIPVRKSSAKASHLRIKTAHTDKERKALDAKSQGSPNSPSPKSKRSPKLTMDLPGIPETETETMGRYHRRPSLSMIQPLPSQRLHINKSSRPPVSLKRYPVRSISAPLPGQEPPLGPPREMMDLVNQRQVKFTNIREEKLRRLSSLNNTPGASRPGSRMGRRHASAPVSETNTKSRKRQRRRSGPVRPSFVQRMSLSQRRQSVSQAIKDYIRSPRRRPSWLMMPLRRTRSKTR